MALQRRQRRVAAEAARRGSSSIRQRVALAVRTLTERATGRSAAVVPLEDPDLDQSGANQPAAVTAEPRRDLEWPDRP